MNAKKIVFIVVILIIAVIVLVVLFLKNQPSPNLNGENREKIVVANIGEHSIFNLIAKEKGFFEANGLDAEVNEYPSGPPAVSDLLAGKADFAVAADFVGVTTISKDKRLRILAEVSKHDIFKVVSRKDKGINQPSDLRGKKIGVTRVGVGEFFLGSFLTANGLTFTDIQAVDLQPPAMIEQLKNGVIDSIIIFDPHAYNIQQDMGEDVIIWSAQGNQRVFATLYTTIDYVTAHSLVVRRYMKSLLEAENFLQTNMAEAKETLVEKMGYEKDYVEYMWPQFDWTISLDQALLLTLEDEERFRITNKLATEMEIPNYIDYIYYQPLLELDPLKVNIIGLPPR